MVEGETDQPKEILDAMRLLRDPDMETLIRPICIKQ
jgi:uncharacterized protein YjgD (DUF1641 family)